MEEVKSGPWLFHFGPEQMLINYVSQLSPYSRLSVYAPISGGKRFPSFFFFQNFRGHLGPFAFPMNCITCLLNSLEKALWDLNWD